MRFSSIKFEMHGEPHSCVKFTGPVRLGTRASFQMACNLQARGVGSSGEVVCNVFREHLNASGCMLACTFGV